MEAHGRFLSLSLFCCLFICIGCSPAVKKRIEVPFVPVEPGDGIALEKYSLSLDEIKDSRPTADIADVHGNPIQTEGNAVQGVRSALESALRREGFGISDSAPLILGPQVKKWFANVHGGMPSVCDADAELFVQVFDPANKLIYSGSYTGASTLQEPAIDEQDIRQTLGAAMSEAIRQLTSDKQLKKLLESY